MDFILPKYASGALKLISSYVHLTHYDWVDATVGGLLVPEDSFRLVASIRYWDESIFYAIDWFKFLLSK